MTTSWTSLGTLNFTTFPSGVFGPHIRDIPYHLHGVTFLTFFGVLATRYSLYTPKRIFTKNTPKDVVPAKDVPFGGPDDQLIKFRKAAIFNWNRF